MNETMPAPEIVELQEQLNKADEDAGSLAAGLSEELGAWRSGDGSWSVAQCLEHLALTNAMYVQAMQKASDRGRERGRLRRGPAVPGVVGRWLARSVEPPVKQRSRMKTSRSIEPSGTISVMSALEDFRMSQERVRAFLVRESDLDLASIRFANPFIPGLRLSVATGLNILTAHERRHLWQAWGVRRAAEGVRVSP